MDIESLKELEYKNMELNKNLKSVLNLYLQDFYFVLYLKKMLNYCRIYWIYKEISEEILWQK